MEYQRVRCLNSLQDLHVHQVPGASRYPNAGAGVGVENIL